MPLSNGIDFLGYITKPNSVFVRTRVLKNFRNKVKQYNKLVNDNKIADFDKKQFVAVKASYFGHFKHADYFKIKKYLLNSISS